MGDAVPCSDSERPVPDHTPWFLTFQDACPGGSATDEITALLGARSIVASVASVADGDALGSPGTVVAVVASDEAGHILLDLDGRLASGQPIEHLVAGLAHLTGYQVLVDDTVVVLPDGSEEEPTDEVLATPDSRTLVGWRTTPESAALVRAVAYGVGETVSHATVGSWTIVALPEGYDIEGPEQIGGRGERPIVIFCRTGVMRSLRWYHRENGRSVSIELLESTWPGAAAIDPAPHTETATVLASLGSFSFREVPETALLSAEVQSSLLSLPRRPDTLLGAASRLLEIPAELSAELENAPVTGSGRWLGLPGTVEVAPDSSMPTMLVGAARDVLLHSVQGTGRRGVMRRWLWRRPAAFLTFAAAEIAFGLAQGIWAASGGDLWGQGWLLWVVAALWAADGGLNLTVGLAALRHRASTRPSR